MAVNGDHLDMIKALRGLGVIHYKAADFEATLGYPFGEAPKPVREGGKVTPAAEVTNAADLVLNPPDLSKAVEDK